MHKILRDCCKCQSKNLNARKFADAGPLLAGEKITGSKENRFSSCLFLQVNRYMCGPMHAGKLVASHPRVSWTTVPVLTMHTLRISDGDEIAYPSSPCFVSRFSSRGIARCTDSPPPISRRRRRSAPRRSFHSARISSSLPSEALLVRNTPIFLHDFGPCTLRASWVLRRQGGVQNSSFWGISACMLHESASRTCFQFGCHRAGLLAAPRCAHFACTSCCFLLHLTRNNTGETWS